MDLCNELNLGGLEGGRGETFVLFLFIGFAYRE